MLESYWLNPVVSPRGGAGKSLQHNTVVREGAIGGRLTSKLFSKCCQIITLMRARGARVDAAAARYVFRWLTMDVLTLGLCVS